MPVPRLTRDLLSTARVIARGAGIRDVARLVRQYGGRVRGWSKKSTRPIRGYIGYFEYHWYEHHGVGRFEIKRVLLQPGPSKP